MQYSVANMRGAKIDGAKTCSFRVRKIAARRRYQEALLLPDCPFKLVQSTLLSSSRNRSIVEWGIFRYVYGVFGGEDWESYSCSSHGHRQQERELGNPLFVKWYKPEKC